MPPQAPWTIDAYETEQGEKPVTGAVKRKTAFMEWIGGQLEADPRLARKVDDLVNKMKLEQELTGLREKRGLSQRQLAKLLGTSQPYVAKLESGRIKNLGVNTLVKYARALGGSVTIKIEPDKRAVAARSARLRKAG